MEVAQSKEAGQLLIHSKPQQGRTSRHLRCGIDEADVCGTNPNPVLRPRHRNPKHDAPCTAYSISPALDPKRLCWFEDRPLVRPLCVSFQRCGDCVALPNGLLRPQNLD